MTLTPGTRLGPYEVVAPLGAGGMGEVYRARDTRLGRDVAVKVLPAEVAGDPDRLSRFEHEARAAAALNHSNILALYDVGSSPAGDASDIRFIVTELLEGRTLRQVLDEERLSLSRVIDHAAQIADGLAAAHAHGIVHRDIKPENIFITNEGRAKILDFGLAKPIVPVDGRAAVEAPTRSATDPHTVLGTAGYMAPEQVRGQAIDHRADVFAFGAVLYEMLAGRRAFAGDTALDTMSAILREAPAPVPSSIERPVPPALVRLIERCLEKSPAARFQSTTDLAFALKSLSQTDSHATAALAPIATPATRSSFVWAFAPWIAAGIFALTTLVLWHPWSSPVEAPPPLVVRFAIAPPEGAEFGPISAASGVAPFPAVSPDGQQLMFLADKPGEPTSLWLRPLRGIDAREIPGTADARRMFWSPDGRSVGFFSRDSKLRRLDLESGLVQTLCDAPAQEGGAWGPDGTIIFSAENVLKQIPAGGGSAAPLTVLDETRRETSHRHPEFLPDGRHFLYQSAPDHSIWIGSLDGSAPERLMSADSGARFAPPGMLLFVRQTTLFAQPFDLDRRALLGEPVPIAEDIRTGNSDRAAFTVSQTGVLVYRTGDSSNRSGTLTWLDRNQRTLGTVKSSRAVYQGLALLPDERGVIAHIHDDGQNGGDLWRIDLESGARSRVTSDPQHDNSPVISPDGRRVAWASNRVGRVFSIFRKPSSGVGIDEAWVTMEPQSIFPSDWAKDWFVFTSNANETGADIWVAPVGDPAGARPYLQTKFDEQRGRLSPDGRWMAYDSNESGRRAVYLRPFPDLGEDKWIVSGPGPEDGWSPEWRNDGKELFYMAWGNRLMSASLSLGSRSPVNGQRELLRLNGLNQLTVTASRDGQRFLVLMTPDAGAPTPLTVVINWPSLLAPPVPGGVR